MGMKAREKAATKPIIVCTDKRGVFFGYVPEGTDIESLLGGKVTLYRARMCVHWTQAERGLFGLAVGGPGDGCRIGPAIGALAVDGVHGVLEVGESAVARWEAAPWGE